MLFLLLNREIRLFYIHINGRYIINKPVFERLKLIAITELINRDSPQLSVSGEVDTYTLNRFIIGFIIDPAYQRKHIITQDLIEVISFQFQVSGYFNINECMVNN